MNITELTAALTDALANGTPEEIAALRAALRELVFGPGASLDDAGNLSVAGNLSADGATWAGKGLALTPVPIASLNHQSGAIQLVVDALNPVAGEPVVAGGNDARLVRLDGGAFRAIGER